MRRRATFLTLALVAGLAVAGCGVDNGSDNDNGTPNATITRTPTPVAPTTTPTETETSDVTPTPGPTMTPGPGGACAADSTLTVVSNPGGDLDTGWTGIAHDNETPSEVSVTVDLDCPNGNDCTVDGSSLVGDLFGAPLPLSSGGVPVCVLNIFREAIGGTYTCDEGCGETQVLLESRVFLVQDIAKPCPNCVGDDTPNDGVKNGLCEGNTTTPGAPCDTGAVDARFGETSLDCLPTGSSVGELQVDLNPTTTGTVSVDANVNCLSPAFPAGTCYCPGQIQPNACVPDGVCPASGQCESGPIDQLCSGQTFRACQSNADCEGTFPGAGQCISKARPCFGTNITRTGQCALPGEQGILASVFCIPATRAPAINSTGGLPGPGAVELTGHSIRMPQ